MRIQRKSILAVMAGVVLLAAGCSGSGRRDTVRIGSKNFTEQLVLAELMAQVIEKDTGLAVERVFNLGGTMVCHNGLVRGDLDLYAEYTGTALTAILKQDVVTDPDEAYNAVAAAYPGQFKSRWLQPFGFNNTYTIAIRHAFAEARKLDTISDLAAVAPGLTAGFTAEFMEREDGFPGLNECYGLEFKKMRDMDASLMYRAAGEGQVDVICAFATDGRIKAYDLQVLKDDRQFFPPYYAAPVLRTKLLEAHPEVEQALSRLAGAVSDEQMMKMNYDVDENKISPKEVAAAFLAGLPTSEGPAAAAQ